MKYFKLSIITTLLAAGLLNAQKIILEGVVEQSPDAEVKINTPIAGRYYSGNNAITKIKDGKYRYEVELSKPGIVTLSNDFRYTYLFAEPGKTYNINFSKKGAEYAGKEAEQQQFLKDLGLYLNPRNTINIDAHKTVEAKEAYYEEKLKNAEQKLKQALESSLISPSNYDQIYNLIKLKIQDFQSTDYYFTFRSDYEQSPEKWNDFKNNYLKSWQAIYSDAYANPTFTAYPGQVIFIERYKGLKDIEQHGTLQFGNQNVPYRVASTDFYKTNVPKPLIENAWANTIYDGIADNKFEKEWISNFNAFKKAYPQSPLTKLVAKDIKRVEDYHNTSNKKGAEFIKDYDKITSFTDLFKNLKGKVSYVDMWATWCAPCRIEMQYSKKNHDILEKMGVQSVYLSVDRDKDDEKWKKMITSLDLEGLHLRSVNPKFKKEIDGKIGNGIPYYIIVGKDGEVKKWGAKRPSDQQDLFDELKNYLD